MASPEQLTCGGVSYGPSSDGLVLRHGKGHREGWGYWDHCHQILELERRDGEWYVTAVCPHFHRNDRTARDCRMGENN